jgi:hypothetical protein
MANSLDLSEQRDRVCHFFDHRELSREFSEDGETASKPALTLHFEKYEMYFAECASSASVTSDNFRESESFFSVGFL